MTHSWQILVIIHLSKLTTYNTKSEPGDKLRTSDHSDVSVEDHHLGQMYLSGTECWQWGSLSMWGQVVYGNSPISMQFCCGPKSPLKNKIYLKKREGKNHCSHQRERISSLVFSPQLQSKNEDCFLSYLEIEELIFLLVLLFSIH